MQVNVQNRTVLYAEADLVDVRRFSNVFGERVRLVFKIASGPHLGIELMEAAALKAVPRGKLTELLRGTGGADGSLPTAHDLVGGAATSLCAMRPTKPTQPSRRRSASVMHTAKGPTVPKGRRWVSGMT
jgi:hypothetical protein